MMMKLGGRVRCAESGVTIDAAETQTRATQKTFFIIERSREVGLLVIPFIHPAPEHPPAERPKPLEHVILVSEIHQLDQVAVEVLGKEERVAAGRSLRLADAFDAARLKVGVPFLEIADVE